MNQSHLAPSRALLLRILPFLAWRAVITRETLHADAIAGITVAMLVIPQALAYAQLAGMPPYYGLYTALVPCVVGVLFGSSAILVTGPSAVTSLLTAASLAPLAAAGSPGYVALAIFMAVLTGAIQLGFGVLRMGVLLNFISYPVLMGFFNAATIIIALSQLPAMLGIAAPTSDSLLSDTWAVLLKIHLLQWPSLAFGLAAIAALIVFRKYLPRLPGALITVAVLTLASYAIGYEQMGGSVVGDIPGGLPHFTAPHVDWNTTIALLPAAFVIAPISFMEAMSNCKVIAIKTRTAWDENQELIGQGLAKLASAFSGTFPSGGSFSRSALNLSAGAKTGISSLLAATVVLLTLVFFTSLLHHLPKSVLAAIIIVALVNLMDYGSIVRSWRAGGDDGIAAIITFIATLAFAPGIHIGILAGILVSLALLLYRLMRPRVALVSMHEHGMMRDMQRHGLPSLHPAIDAVRFDGSLIFVNVSYFEDAVTRLALEKPQLRYVLVVGSGINAIDASGAEMLAELVERLRSSGVTLVFSGIKAQVKDVMDRTGLSARIGHDNIFASDAAALHALRARLGD